jgi:hypothetical protein
MLVPPGDELALGAALSEVLGGGPVVTELVEAGSMRAEALSMDSLALRYLELYARVV